MPNDATANRLFVLLALALLLKFGLNLWQSLPPGDAVHTVAVILAYGVSAGGLVLVGSGLDWFDRHAREIAYATLIAFAFGVAVLYLSAAWDSGFGTDALLFSRYSADLVLQGHNPYAHSMLAGVQQYDTTFLHVTPKTDGTVIGQLSYPALSVVWFLPQAALGTPPGTLGLTVLVFATALGGLLIHVSPLKWVFAPIVFLSLPRTLFMASVGGILGALWLLPVAGAMVLLYDRRVTLAGGVFGLAVATKQHPWIIAPFALLFVYHHRGGLNAAARFVGASVASFGLVNLPFILWGPLAWAKGVLTPVLTGGAPMVMQGSGLALLTVTQTYSLTKDWHTLALVTATLVGLLVYHRHPDGAGWAAFLVPPAILFFNYRSLNSYFVTFVPLAYLAVLLATDSVRTRRWSCAAA